MLPTKFLVSWPFRSVEAVPNTFPRWQRWRPCWIPDGNDFTYFLSTSHINYFLSSLESVGLSSQEKKFKIDLKVAAVTVILGF